jgi:hypothetical protein
MQQRDDHMQDRRAHSRIRLDDTAWIAVDEHCSLPCVVFDRSLSGVRVALPEADQVPDLFVLTLDSSREVLVCRTVWRKAEEVGATTDMPGAVVRPSRSSLRRQPAPE